MIEHVPDPPDFLRKIRCHLTENSRLMLATPNLGCARAQVLGADWEAVGPVDHLYLFDSVTLGRLLESAGFSVLSLLESGTDREELLAIANLPASSS